MASIGVGGAQGARKVLSTEIPLTPFIDLLLCCVMFLLVTAVWNQLASLDAQARAQASQGVDAPVEDALKLAVHVSQAGYEVTTGAGDRVVLPRQQGQLDVAALRERMKSLRTSLPANAMLTLLADDGVPMASVTSTMDTLRGAGFAAITLTGSE